VVVLLQVGSPQQQAPRWWPAVIGAEVLLLAPVVASNPVNLIRKHVVPRVVGALLAALVLAANATRLIQLLLAITRAQRMAPGSLVGSGVLIWITNVVVTAIIFWELDGGGPFVRAGMMTADRPADLLFPQRAGVPGWDPQEWRPSFTDYVFVAFTAATAFSPTDTLPLTGRAKAVMMLAASVSLLTIAIVGARAVNLL
jgi:hypothetical protein